MTEQAKISWISPLPPQPSGVANYAREVLPLLRRHYEVESYEDAQITEEEALKATAADLLLCHVGNNSKFHESAYRLALRHPSLVVLHDLCCHHLVADLTLGRGRVREYVTHCEASDGEEGRRNAERNAAFGFQEELGFQILCVKPVVDASLGILVHSAWAEKTLRRICPQAWIRRIPFVVIGKSWIDRTVGRNLPFPTILLPGFVTRPKLPFHLLTAVRRLAGRGHYPRLVFGGGCSFQEELERAADRLGIGERVLFTGSMSEEEYHEVLSQATVCACLRDPSAGESSATLWQAMAHGKPCVVIDHAGYAELPSGTVAKVSPGLSLIDQLEAVFDRLLDDPILRSSLGREAKMFIQEEHPHEAVEEGYLQAVKSFLAGGEE